MRLMNWQFNELSIPMMEDERGTLYTTTGVLCGALGVVENDLRNIYLSRRDEFDGLSVNNLGANDFIRANKEIFCVQRVRQDMHLWSEDDMILFAAISRSDQGKEFRKQMVQLVKQQARKTYISREEYDRMVGELMIRIGKLEQEKDQVRPAMQESASAFGRGLSYQRRTKTFRQ